METKNFILELTYAEMSTIKQALNMFNDVLWSDIRKQTNYNVVRACNLFEEAVSYQLEKEISNLLERSKYNEKK